MRTVTESQFRRVVVLTLFLFFLVNVLPFIEPTRYSEPVASLDRWQGYGALVPVWASLAAWGGNIVLGIVSYIGLIRFKPFSRWLLGFLWLAGALTAPLFGIWVATGLEAGLSTAYALLSIWLLTVCFWTPLAERFVASGHTGNSVPL